MTQVAFSRNWPRAAFGFLLLVVLLVASLAVQAQSQTESPLRHGQGLLWRIDTPGKPSSYLFGTMHSTDPKIVKLPQPVAAALTESRSLVIEMLVDGQVQGKMAAAMQLGGGRTLDGLIGAENFQALSAIGTRYGMTPPALQRLAPWAAMTIISLTPAEFARIREGHLPLDHALQLYAEERGVPVYGLESVEEQIAVFSGTPEPEQISLLDLAIRSHPRLESWFRQMKDAYLTRDLAALVALMNQQAASGDAQVVESFEDRLIDRRNKRMAVRMMERLEEGGTFVAVGALHLPGDLGLVALLQAQGRTLTRVY